LRKDFVKQSEGDLSLEAHGWFSWFWGSDIRLLFWMRDAEGRTIGGEVAQVILTSDIINYLPHTQSKLDLSAARDVETRIRLVNSRLELIYQWGSYEVPEGSKPISTRSLSSPLSAWSLQLFQSTDPLENAGSSILLTIIVSTLALGLVLAGLGAYFYREYSRDLKEASQRVSFVNQVSHELKTPLTNIRLYTELLAKRLKVGDSKAAEYAEIIVSENQRLSRLIGNVLSFGRKERDKLTLNRSQGQVDEQIANVLESYRPALVATGIELDVDLNADLLVFLDGDVIRQVLGNLLSNVEKYAGSGKYLRIESRRVGDITRVTVTDKGPGVPQTETEKIFEPFYRIDNRLNAGVSGTGIGLSIARDLAQLHGGDLKLIPSEQGASFELSLLTPTIEEKN
jgi:signal transduction histidine kinase